MSVPNEDLYELQWNNHSKILKGSFDLFRTDNELIDVTLSCEGKKLKAHKIVLSACSLYFLDLFRDNPCKHPIIIMRDIKYQAMVDILNFMYIGEVNVATDELQTFLKTAEYLQVKGLSEKLPLKINQTESNFGTKHNVKDSINLSKSKVQREEKTQSDSVVIEDLSEHDSLNSNHETEDCTNEYSNQEMETNQNQTTLIADSESNDFDSIVNFDLTKEDRKKSYSTLIPSFRKTLSINEKDTLSSKSIPVISKIKNKRKRQIERTEETEPSIEQEQTESLKTECIDLDDITKDEVRILGLEQNFNDQDYDTQFAFMQELNGPASSSAPVKMFVCPLCKKEFNHNISLKLHLPTHSGATSCTVCHAVLGRRYNLKMHMRRVHHIEMEKACNVKLSTK